MTWREETSCRLIWHEGVMQHHSTEILELHEFCMILLKRVNDLEMRCSDCGNCDGGCQK